MMPETAEILRSHVTMNYCLNVNVIVRALGETSGRAVKASVVEGRSGISSIAGGKVERQITVKTVSLSEELKDVSLVHLIKMDLEGAELGALKGADLSKVRAIVFENSGDDNVLNHIEAQGFVVTRLDKRNVLGRRTL
jgi:FkbM family methyltransferase